MILLNTVQLQASVEQTKGRRSVRASHDSPMVLSERKGFDPNETNSGKYRIDIGVAAISVTEKCNILSANSKQCCLQSTEPEKLSCLNPILIREHKTLSLYKDKDMNNTGSQLVYTDTPPPASVLLH